MLSISRVPTLVVIENKTGKVITLNGMEAIEWSEPDKLSSLIEDWRKGRSGVPLTARILNGCNII